MSDSVSDNNSNGDYDSNYEENSVSNSVNAEEINSLDGNKNNESNKSKLKHGKLVKEAKRYKEKLEKRGVVYLSRVPPFMKPNKVRTLFEEYGEVTRLYLAEEGTSSNCSSH